MDNEAVSPEQEMVQDMLAIVDCFSARLYGLRNYRKALRKALENDTRTQDSLESNA
jgi:predicted site-specific integrase-resolvase